MLSRHFKMARGEIYVRFYYWLSSVFLYCLQFLLFRISTPRFIGKTFTTDEG